MKLAWHEATNGQIRRAFIRLVDLLRETRATLLFTIAIILAIVAISSIVRGQDTNQATERAERSALSAEHRFTQLETRVDNIAHDVSDTRNDIKTYGWLIMAALSGLVGEKAFGLVKGRKTNGS